MFIQTEKARALMLFRLNYQIKIKEERKKKFPLLFLEQLWKIRSFSMFSKLA